MWKNEARMALQILRKIDKKSRFFDEKNQFFSSGTQTFRDRDSV